MNRITKLILFAWLLLRCIVPATAQTMTGVVIDVLNGDTLSVLVQGKEHRVHLAEIDAPDMGQKYSQTSRKALHDLVFGKTVTLHPVSIDPEGTSVAHVRLGQMDASLEQVRRGMAWPYDPFVRDKQILHAGIEARRAKIGLFRDRHAVPPWIFRKGGQRALIPVNAAESARLPVSRQRDDQLPVARQGDDRLHAIRKKDPNDYRPARSPRESAPVAERDTDWRAVTHRGERIADVPKRGSKSGGREGPTVSQAQIDAYLRHIPDAQPTKSGAFKPR